MKRGIVSKANWKRDGRQRKLPNGLKKHILAMPCRVKPFTITFFSLERGVEKAGFERIAASGERAEKEKRGRGAGENTGNDPYRHPSCGNKRP
jgi:hypothetical protein